MTLYRRCPKAKARDSSRILRCTCHPLENGPAVAPVDMAGLRDHIAQALYEYVASGAPYWHLDGPEWLPVTVEQVRKEANGLIKSVLDEGPDAVLRALGEDTP